MDTDQQVGVYRQLENHFKVVMYAPCNAFPGYPFKVDWTSGQHVSITAVIEHFEDKQQEALVIHFNTFLRSSGSCGIFEGVLPSMLRAAKLERCEGGIQFEVKDGDEEHLMDKMGACGIILTRTPTS